MSLSRHLRRLLGRQEAARPRPAAVAGIPAAPVPPSHADREADWFVRSLSDDAGAGREVEGQGEALSEAGYDWLDPLAPSQQAVPAAPVDDDHDGARSHSVEAKRLDGASGIEDLIEIVEPELTPAAQEDVADETAYGWIDDEASAPMAAGGDAEAEAFDFYPEDVSLPPPQPSGPQGPSRPDVPDAKEYRIRVDAALLVDAFCGGVASRRPAVAKRLRAILRDFPHSASRRAIERLGLAGLDLDDLEELAEIKRLWRDDPALWMMRRPPNVMVQSSSLRRAMSWKLARQLQRAWPGEACTMLSDELLGQWVSLSRRPGDSSGPLHETFFIFTTWLRMEAETTVASYKMPARFGRSTWDYIMEDEVADTAALSYRENGRTLEFASLDSSFWRGRAYGETVPIPDPKTEAKGGEA